MNCLLSEGDALAYHLGMMFSTKDQDNDAAPKNSHSCAVVFHGAWWYRRCHHSNLNGRYYPRSSRQLDAVAWKQWKGQRYSLKFTEMKIRPYV